MAPGRAPTRPLGSTPVVDVEGAFRSHEEMAADGIEGQPGGGLQAGHGWADGARREVDAVDPMVFRGRHKQPALAAVDQYLLDGAMHVWQGHIGPERQRRSGLPRRRHHQPAHEQAQEWKGSAPSSHGLLVGRYGIDREVAEATFHGLLFLSDQAVVDVVDEAVVLRARAGT